MPGAETLSFFVLTAWARASTSVKVGEERVQLIRAEKGISTELPLQCSCYFTQRDFEIHS